MKAIREEEQLFVLHYYLIPTKLIKIHLIEN